MIPLVVHVCVYARKGGGFYALLDSISVITCNISCLIVSLFDWLIQHITGIFVYDI